MTRDTVKCVAVGDPGVGKTCLLVSFCTNKFPTEFVPTLFDNYAVTVMIGDEPYTLGVFDTVAKQDYDRLRPLSYPATDVFLLCFSIDSPESFESVTEKWFPEVQHHRPGVTCMLVGTKVDLRDKPDVVANLAERNQRPVPTSAGEQLATEIGAYKYAEVSALTQYKVTELFDEARHYLSVLPR